MGDILVFDPARRHNGDLIRDAAQLGWLPEPVFDATYGDGKFWSEYKPETLITNDRYKPADHQWNWRQPVHPQHGWRRQFGCVVFDPDYKLCLDFATEVLTREGWKTYDKVRPGDKIWSLDHETGMADWERCTAVNIYPTTPTKVGVVEGRHLSIVATPDHRWPVVTHSGARIWKTTDELTHNDHLIQRAKWARTPGRPTLPDALVELVAWFWTEGSMRKGTTYGDISQSHVVNSRYCERIANCFRTLYGEPVDKFARTGRTSVPAWRQRHDDRRTFFIFSAAVGQQLARWAPCKVPSPEFLELLTADQMELFIDSSFDADGQRRGRLSQSDEKRSTAFAMACLMSGRAVSTRVDPNGHTTTVLSYKHVRPARSGITWEDRDVGVWCPTVERTGTWLARRRGCVYFTGNSGTSPTEGWMGEMNYAYGVDKDKTVGQRMDDIRTGAINCSHLVAVGGFLLVKCMDQIACGQMQRQTDMVIEALEPELRFESWLHLPMKSVRPQRSQRKPRNNYSTLLAFKRRR